MKIIKIANLDRLEIQYTGLVSPESIKNGRETPWAGLVERFDIPEGWITHGHHMTINLGANKDFNTNGAGVRMRALALGKSDKALALLVESGLSIQNEHQHITIATAPDAQPKDSNDITNWEPIQPFPIDGFIAEVSSGGLIVTEEMKAKEEDRLEKIRLEKQRIGLKF